MKRSFIAAVLVAIVQLSYAQQSSKRTYKTTPIEFSGGLSWSGLDFQTYSQQKRAKPGANFKTIIKVNRALRLSAEYTLHFKHKDNPSWTDIRSNNIDFNVHACGTVSGSDVGFYTVTGITLLNWNGTFTGYRDEKNDGILKLPGQQHSYNKLMLNVGMGFEREFQLFSAFAEVKFRFAEGIGETKVAINDVYYCFGIKAPLRIPVSTKKTRIKMPGDKYHWF